MILEFPDRFFKNLQILSLMKIPPVGAELFDADGERTDMTKLIVVFSNFAKSA